MWRSATTARAPNPLWAHIFRPSPSQGRRLKALAPGTYDVIVKANTAKVGSLKDLRAAIKDQASILLTIRRGASDRGDSGARSFAAAPVR